MQAWIDQIEAGRQVENELRSEIKGKRSESEAASDCEVEEMKESRESPLVHGIDRNVGDNPDWV